MASAWASCPRNQEVERTPSRLLGTSRWASAPSVKGSREAEEGSSEEAEQVKNATRLPWSGWEGEERAGEQWDQRQDAGPTSNPSCAGENECRRELMMATVIIIIKK